ncbi:alpha/beta hydrolase [Snodgrassella sp. CFCC 13594]|uniref:alpha/beta hydrolase n=1 Tax=Snodgrassella sp. CFCC 13594 TaxID=1775559 RepID=UPI00082DEAF5|nr:alpha/beta hydrolase-fold protein [Snodgrassella sp. CFCC 13594]
MRRLWLCFLCLLSSLVMAQPDLTRKADLSVLQQTNSGYQFHTLPFHSADGLRHYRVFVGVPQKKAPTRGFATFYALDGNAMLEMLTPQRLKTLAATPNAPVIVMLGYATDLRLDAASRAYDYTISHPETPVAVDALHPERRNGGADIFLQLLRTQIMPSVDKLAPINRAQQTLWGHSYGGLFVIHTLFTQPQLFQRYIAADPAIWVHEGAILAEQQRFMQPGMIESNTQLWLMKSGTPNSGTQHARSPNQTRQRARQAIPRDALMTLGQQLSQAHSALHVYYQTYPEDTHGSLFPKSFQAALFGADPFAYPSSPTDSLKGPQL